MKNRRKAVQPFEIKKRKIDIFRNYEANGFEKNQRKFENFSTLISKKSTDWNQSAPVDTQPKLKDFKKTISDYLAWEITNLLKNDHEENFLLGK